MDSNRLWLWPLAFACVAAVAIPSAQAGGKKAKAETLTLNLSNLTTETPAKQIKALQKSVKKVKGVAKVTVDKKKGVLTVKHSKKAAPDAIKAAVGAAGFTVVVPAAEIPEDEAVDDFPPED